MKLINSVVFGTVLLSISGMAPIEAKVAKKKPSNLVLDQAGIKYIHGSFHPERIKGEYIVTFKSQTSKLAISELIGRFSQGKASAKLKSLHSIKAISGRLSNTELEQLQRHPQVLSIEMDRKITLPSIDMPLQRAATDAWSVDRLDQITLPLDGGFTPSAHGAGVHAYIIDTGIRTDHVQFEGRAQWAFTASNIVEGNDDLNGRGTHMAGTVGSNAWGVATQANLYSVKVANSSGATTLSALLEGINYVTNNHQSPAVAVMAYSTLSSQALDDAVNAAINAGVVFAVPAGDETRDSCLYSPANLDGAITVAASSAADGASPYTNHGSCVDVYAPGLYVKSAWHSGDTHNNSISHTPTSAAHVAGAAAVILSQDGSCSPAQVKQQIIDEANVDRLSNMPANTANRLLHLASSQTVDCGSNSGDGAGDGSGDSGITLTTGVLVNSTSDGNHVCMGVASEASGAHVIAVNCDASAPKWQLTADGRFNYMLNEQPSGWCVDADLGHPYDNNKLKLYDCNGLQSNQTFSWQQSGVLSLVANGRCIASQGIGNQMITGGCNANEQMFHVFTGSGKLRLLSSNSNQCLGLNGNVQAGVGTTLVDCDSAPQWSVEHVGIMLNNTPTRIRLVDDTLNICLDNDTGNPYYGHLVGTYYCNGLGINQTWIYNPEGLLILQHKNQCLSPASNPAVNGEQNVMGGCNSQFNAWAFF